MRSSLAPLARLAPLALAASAFVFAACTEDVVPPSGASPDAADSGRPSTGQRADALVYNGACTPSSCPPFDPSSTASVATCSAASGSCGWNTGPDTSVSFRQCEEAACGTKPDIVCQDGYQANQGACGSENDGPCAWQTRCTPRITEEPCPDSACGPVQAIAHICSEDGGFEGPMAEWRCRKLTTGACIWESYCAE